jgi:hypothetical protein
MGLGNNYVSEYHQGSHSEEIPANILNSNSNGLICECGNCIFFKEIYSDVCEHMFCNCYSYDVDYYCIECGKRYSENKGDEYTGNTQAVKCDVCLKYFSRSDKRCPHCYKNNPDKCKNNHTLAFMSTEKECKQCWEMNPPRCINNHALEFRREQEKCKKCWEMNPPRCINNHIKPFSSYGYYDECKECYDVGLIKCENNHILKQDMRYKKCEECIELKFTILSNEDKVHRYARCALQSVATQNGIQFTKYTRNATLHKKLLKIDNPILPFMGRYS